MREPVPLTIALREEIGNPALFTGRGQELAYWMTWVERVEGELGQSHVILARKRRGKTALVQRLYNILYTRNNPRVIPFYFRVPEGQTTTAAYSRLFLHTLLSQYLGFKHRKPEYIGKTPLEADALRKLVQDDAVLRDLFNAMEDHLEKGDHHAAWRLAREGAHTIADRKDERIIQIIDEFQFLNQFVYTDDSYTTKHHLATFYQETGSSKVAPQIITGSYIGWLSKIVDHMVGRYRKIYLANLPVDEAVACVNKYATVHRVPVTDESTTYLAEVCDNDPYYIAALFQSSCPDLDLTTRPGIRRALDFEITQGGDITSMWQEYIHTAFARVNDRIAKKVVLYLARHGDTVRTRHQIKADLNLTISDEDLEDRLEKLVYADLIRAGDASSEYKGLGDPIFAMFFRKRFRGDIENIDQSQDSLPELPANLEAVSVPDRLQMIQTIWESIEAELQSLPLTKAQERKLDKRLAAHRQSPDDVVPWEDIKRKHLGTL